MLNFHFGFWLLEKKPPLWIWKTIASFPLETIGYCHSRFMIGCRPYERAILYVAHDEKSKFSYFARREPMPNFFFLNHQKKSQLRYGPTSGQKHAKLRDSHTALFLNDGPLGASEWSSATTRRCMIKLIGDRRSNSIDMSVFLCEDHILSSSPAGRNLGETIQRKDSGQKLRLLAVSTWIILAVELALVCLYSSRSRKTMEKNNPCCLYFC